MTIKKQILLPKSAFALANDEDVFINVQLNKTFTDLKTEKINNVFNINKQYDTERQSSLKFCIFGLFESKFANTSNLIIDVKESGNLTLSLPKIASDNITGKTLSIKSFELTLDSNGMSRNLYGKTKSAYSILFEINKSELDAQNAQTIIDGGVPKTRTVDFTIVDNEKNIFFITSIPYLFYDLDGNAVPFGSQTADVDENGNTTEINNDFPFLYDRHWIKQYFNLPAPSFVFLPDKTINVSENTSGETQISAGLSAETVNLNISIDQPSPYGLEEATVIIDMDSTVRNPNLDFNFTPQTIKWNVGEQHKTFNLSIIDDKFVENTESIFFKVVDFKYCTPRNDTDITMEVQIVDDDVSSQIRFVSGSSTVKNSVSVLTVSYVFDKPVEVPEQSVTLFYTTNTDAILGTDFILDVNNPTAKELIIKFNQGDISGSTTIIILDKDGYDVDKTLELSFKNLSQNIVMSNIGALPDIGQSFRATIKNSVVSQFSSFVLINNPVKNIGAIKSFKSPDQYNRYQWSRDSELGFGVATLYDISIINAGANVVYGNNLISTNSLVTTITVSAQQLSDIVIDLPSNSSYDKPNKKYKKSKYDFSIVSKDKFITNETANFDFGFAQSYSYSSVTISTEKDAGPSGSSKYYLTTKLTNFYLNYDTVNSACTTNGDFNVVDVAYTNNLVFKGYNQFSNPDLGSTIIVTDSLIETTFETSKIPAFCSQFFPFGFGQIPNPPYQFEYVNINFRNVYPQSTTPLNGEFNDLKFDTLDQPNKKGFIKWANASTDTKHALILSILNNGDVSANVSGSTIAPGEKLLIRGFEQELNDLSLTLPTNESFVKSKSGFTFANYILSVENVVYFSSNGQASGSPVSFKFVSTNTLSTGPLNSPPQYFIVSEFSNMLVPHQGTDLSDTGSSIDCSSINFGNFSNKKATNVGVRGLLLPNSNSGFIRGYFVDANNDLPFTCSSESVIRIPFKKL